MLTKLSVNIPFVKVLEQIPGYANFIKNLLTKKIMVCFEPVTNFQYCSSIASQSLVEKKKDLKVFTISCTIRSSNFS